MALRYMINSSTNNVVERERLGYLTSTSSQEVWRAEVLIPTTTMAINQIIEDKFINLFQPQEDVKDVSCFHKEDSHEFYIFYIKSKSQYDQLEKYFNLEIKIIDSFESHLFDFHYLPYKEGGLDYINYPFQKKMIYSRV